LETSIFNDILQKALARGILNIANGTPVGNHCFKVWKTQLWNTFFRKK